MTAISLDLQWLQPPNEWKWDAEKEEAKEEDDWAKAFANVKGENPFELIVGTMMAIGAVLNGDEHNQEGEKAQKVLSTVEAPVDSKAVQEREPEPEAPPSQESLPAINEDYNSPSRQLLNKMLGMSTLSFSKLPAEADVGAISPAHSAPLKRQRTVSFSELPEIHHVESFKDMPGLWDSAYFMPQPVASN
jgi:hypothetical protein